SYFVVNSKGNDFDKIFELAVEGGADDVNEEDGEIEIVGPVEVFKTLSDILRAAKIEVAEAGLRMDANQEIELESVDKTLQVMRTIESIEDLDDVQSVYSNLRITEEAMAAMDS
ncbi:MAG TPA: YebC/PmpR family DNA-binding transcriptional regulator, partial [Anaerolineaceae bacterium]|nr:YebC/PmpR family DNA-binding transcriptional regulator [Anaerolineaceae bacterium]